MASKRDDKMPKRNKKNFRPTKKGAGMTEAGVKEYRKKNPGSKLKTAVTGKVKRGSKAAKRRKSFCARSKGWTGDISKVAYSIQKLIDLGWSPQMTSHESVSLAVKQIIDQETQ